MLSVFENRGASGSELQTRMKDGRHQINKTSRYIRTKCEDAHPLLVGDDVVAAMLLGQVRCQDVEAPAELGKHHVVGVSCRKQTSKKTRSVGKKTSTRDHENKVVKV